MNKYNNSNNNRKCKEDLHNNCKPNPYCDSCNCPFTIYCSPGTMGPTGATGVTGDIGPTGPTGATGTGGVLNYADFYALMPSDNADTVAAGADVDFPQDGPNSGSGITRADASSFTLAEIGTYQIFFQVSVSEAGQLILT